MLSYLPKLYCFLQDNASLYLLVRSLGLIAENTRRDRDNNVELDFGEVNSDKMYLFGKSPDNDQLTTTYGLPYDYNSVGHYAHNVS